MTDTSEPTKTGPTKPTRHINLITIGMAGSGKTTFLGVFFAILKNKKELF